MFLWFYILVQIAKVLKQQVGKYLSEILKTFKKIPYRLFDIHIKIGLFTLVQAYSFFTVIVYLKLIAFVVRQDDALLLVAI